MERRNKIIIAAAIVSLVGLGWLLLLKEIAVNAVLHPGAAEIASLLLFSVGGGIIVSLLPTTALRYLGE